MAKKSDDASPPPFESNRGPLPSLQPVSLKRRLSHVGPWIFLSVLVYTYFQYTAKRSPVVCKCASVYEKNELTPATKAIQFSPIANFAPESHASPYQGWPTDAKDQMWLDMYENGLSLAIDSAAHSHLLHKSERVPVRGRENEYLVSLSIFHQLQCLDMLRQSLYPKRYNSSLVNPDGKVNYQAWDQLDSCVESLRQSLTCSADITATTFEWLDSKVLKPKAVGTRMCRNFVKIQKWAFDRSVTVENKRSHVEKGIVVDYGHVKPDPDAVGAKWAPQNWDKTAKDL